MIRLIISFLCSFIMIFDIMAQQDPYYSQYMFNNMAINPGYAGSYDVVCLTGAHRQQWAGIEGAPETSLFTVNMPIKNKEFQINNKPTNHGLGLVVMNDRLGFDQNVSVGVDYAFVFSPGIMPGKIGIGVGGMFLNKALNASWRVSGGGEWESDPGIPRQDESVTGFDLGVGIFYRAENMYFGLSSSHLLEPVLSYERANYRLRRHFFATAGCTFPLGNPAWEVAPSLMAYSDGVASQFTGNVNLMYNKKVWFGAGYRLNDAMIAMVGFHLFDGVKIGYAFDYSYTSLRSGSHEVMLSYCFSLVKEKVVKKYKSVRFL